MTRWNVPDYRNRKAYPKPKDLDDTYWHWEFLRRRDDYRKAWESHAQPSYEWMLGRSKCPTDSNWFGKKILSPTNPDFVANLQYLITPDNLKVPEQKEKIIEVMNEVAKFKLVLSLPNPANPRPASLSFECDYLQFINDWLLNDLERHKGKNKYMVYKFDLSQPIRPQIQKVEKALKLYQPILQGEKLGRRKIKYNYPLYLRILDAKEAGLKFREIGSEVLNLKSKTDDDISKMENYLASEAHKAYKVAYNLGINFPN